MPNRRAVLTGFAAVVALAAAVPPALADPNPEKNKQALSRTLACDNGETLAATFAGQKGSNFNVTIDKRVFVYKEISIDRLPAGPSDNDEHNLRGIQAFDEEDLVTCGYTTGSGSVVEAIGFFTGRK